MHLCWITSANMILNMMWTFILLFLLGPNVWQANGEDNSTQMYYVKLIIEESAIANITETLSETFVSNTHLKVDNLQTTTTCQSVPDGAECSCTPGFRWSETVCQENTCTFPGNNTHTCVSNTTVSINGSLFLNGGGHHNCLKLKDSNKFQECNNKLLKQMRTVYSTLPGFNTLTIIKYRVGSVIADFELNFVQSINQQDLIKRSENLSSSLSASLSLETTGVVQLSLLSQSPVCNEKHTLKCTLRETLNAPPVWQLRSNNRVIEIYNGTEAIVVTEPQETRVTLTVLSKLWEGEYSCTYHQQFDSINISHKASFVLDLALLPDILITTEPAFPRCKQSSDLQLVRVRCETGNSSEQYVVSWTHEDVFHGASEQTEYGFAVEAIVSCTKPLKTPRMTCTFRNRCNKTRAASTDVNVIYGNYSFCAADGDWGETKAGFTAVLKCTEAAGQRRRDCKLSATQGTWGPEVSACVNRDLDLVLQTANMVDNGLGLMDENAAGVFSQLESVTNDLQSINTFPNMNASVQVFMSLSHKLNYINNETTANDFLDSSSNLLEKSLPESWTTTADEDSVSLAERYLSSVEHLIYLTNVTNVPKKKNIEVATSICTQKSHCNNTVFNVTVTVDSPDPGSVKTAGFKELENYLPSKDETFKPNSIVVSTTTESKQRAAVEVRIHFPLLKPRPRNVQMKCVAWDNSSQDWSGDGCEWQGSSDEGLCICKHLSSFAILMSRYPVHIIGLTEVTYVGLSVSVISLVISLTIELMVWSAVVKTNTLYLRHTAHINVSLCLLVADLCFLASSSPSHVSEMWCRIFAVLKHFCYLSMFFWMWCLSNMLLHQTIFPMHSASKKTYLRLSLFLGYMCPLLIVVITFLFYKAGAEGEYFSRETCWLLYSGLMAGSIHTFVVPVGIIICVNVFSMMVVIMKLLDHRKNTESSNKKDAKVAITVMRSVILLTPIFGVTWIFGFAVMLLDLTSGAIALLVNYVFTLLNAFQVQYDPQVDVPLSVRLSNLSSLCF
ncbi:adhesion G protein-coupled receptor F5 [Cottoperca gobio]|uniref:Adhesion G protein-coupled receptor F5 n=1 Tax=Cottoperca gobio TaxID=56716 RepID=A0A6J2PFW5_COTGO|nr:adhesion G protein-coupled receptor F5-like [Cottoperca gobio]